MKRRLLRPALLFWTALALFLGLVWNRMPLLETIGYEYALFSALLSSLAAGHISTVAVGRPGLWSRRGLPVLFGMAFLLSLPVPAALLGLSLLNGIWIPYCNLGQGLGFFALLPVMGAAVAAALGVVIGIALPGRVRGSIIWFTLFLISLLSGLYSFYATPAVYLFHPFAGYYPGVLYDRLIEIDHRLVTYRLASLTQIAALLTAAAALYDPERGRFTLSRFRLRSRRTAAAAALLGLALSFEALAPTLGHRTDRSRLEDALPVRVATEHLDIFFPVGVDASLRDALTEDARFDLHRVAEYLDVEIEHRIAIFFFLDAAHKGRLIGASETNVAKPWRREVYVLVEPPPHSVLRHELAHAVSADFGRGLFRVSGGLLPNPGLIEGLATAAGGTRGDLTVHQWAAAMKRIALMPPLDQLFGLGFFDVPAGAAYTAAGSFCDYIRNRFGPRALRDAYRLGDFSAATRRPLAELASDWGGYLENVPFTQAALNAAEHRFDRTPVIRTTCVHEVARISKEADAFSAVSAHDAAESRYQAAHRKSGGATATYRDLFWAAVARGDASESRTRAMVILEESGFSEADRNAAAELLADLDRGSGTLSDDGAVYRRLAESAGSMARRRRLLAKAHIAETGPPLAGRLLDILGPVQPRTTDQIALGALTIASAATAAPGDPLLQYLLGRQYFNARAYDSALDCLEHATGADALVSDLHNAAQMLRGEALYHLGRYRRAAAVFDRLASEPSLGLGGQVRVQDWAARARFTARIDE